MNNKIKFLSEADFSKTEEILHLHFCRDTFINSNDTLLLLSEYNRNNSIKIINGYVSPFTRYTKVLRHLLVGLDKKTQYEILSRVMVNGNPLLINSNFSSEALICQPHEIELTWTEFIQSYIEPIISNYRHIFDELDIDIRFAELEYPTTNLYDAFIAFSNHIYTILSKNFELPLLVLKPLERNVFEVNRFLLKKTARSLMDETTVHQLNPLASMRGEYLKTLNGFSKQQFSDKKKVLKRLLQNPSCSIRGFSYISDLELIDLLTQKDDLFFDLFKLDDTITKNYSKSLQKAKTKNLSTYLLNIDIDLLLDKIFKEYSKEDSSKTIVIQEFSRNFDYSKYQVLAEKYGVNIYPSNLITWKDDEQLRDKYCKKMSFIFGLNLLYKNYVK